MIVITRPQKDHPLNFAAVLRSRKPEALFSSYLKCCPGAARLGTLPRPQRRQALEIPENRRKRT